MKLPSVFVGRCVRGLQVDGTINGDTILALLAKAMHKIIDRDLQILNNDKTGSASGSARVCGRYKSNLSTLTSAVKVDYSSEPIGLAPYNFIMIKCVTYPRCLSACIYRSRNAKVGRGHQIVL